MADTFPITTQQQIMDFMDNEDGLFTARCNGLYEYLFLIRNEPARTYGDALLHHIFSVEYMNGHYWPSVQ